MRKCSRCKQDKSQDDFKHYSPNCAQCRKDVQTQYRERIYADPKMYFKYRLRQAEGVAKYKRKEQREGRPQFIRISERYRAIMSCI